MFEELLLLFEVRRRKKASKKKRKRGKKEITPEREEMIRAILAKLRFGFEKSKSDFAVVNEIGLIPDEVRELKPFIVRSRKLGKNVVFARNVTRWLQKTGALETIFIPGVSMLGSRPARKVRGAFAGATPAEIRRLKKGRTLLKEKPRKFVGGFLGRAEFQKVRTELDRRQKEIDRSLRSGQKVTRPRRPKRPFEEARKPKLPSQTATMLREQLSKKSEFKEFTDADWLDFGKQAKKRGQTSSVFTGALSEMLKYLLKNPKGLPVTSSFAEKSVVRPKKVKIQGLSGDKFMGILEKDGLVESERVTAKEALKANHTVEDAKIAKKSPKKLVTLWFAGDELKEMAQFLKKKKIRLQIENGSSDEKIRLPFEIIRLQELLGWVE